MNMTIRVWLIILNGWKIVANLDQAGNDAKLTNWAKGLLRKYLPKIEHIIALFFIQTAWSQSYINSRELTLNHSNVVSIKTNA